MGSNATSAKSSTKTLARSSPATKKRSTKLLPDWGVTNTGSSFGGSSTGSSFGGSSSYNYGSTSTNTGVNVHNVITDIVKPPTTNTVIDTIKPPQTDVGQVIEDIKDTTTANTSTQLQNVEKSEEVAKKQQKIMRDLIKREHQLKLLSMAKMTDEIARRRNRYLSSRVGRRGLIASGSPGTGLSKTVTDRGFMTLGGT